MTKDLERDNCIETARVVLERLEKAGFEAFLVGGCVRELLRGEARRNDLPDAEAGEAAARTGGISDAKAGEATTDADGIPEVAGETICAEGCPVTDIDVTTNALPQEICQVFADLPVIETGIRHGTVTVLLSEPIEITTYRTDGTYSDGRHPDSVRFVRRLEEDLARRDFTVNAMAMDLRGSLVDPFGGKEDLERGILRAVGDPEKRFREDGLRILRALRFAAVLTVPGVTGGADAAEPGAAGFRIEAETEAALFRCAPLLEGISAERIFAELRKLVCGQAAGDVIRRYVDILGEVIPELLPMKDFEQHNPYHKYDILEHCIRAMEVVKAPAPIGELWHESEAPLPEAGMKLAALLHDVGKPQMYTMDEQGIGHFHGHPTAGVPIVRRILKRLKADRFTTERITTLVHYHDLVFQDDDRLLKRWMNRYGPQVLLEILAIKRADNIGTGNAGEDLLAKFDRISQRIREICRETAQGQACFCLKDLAVNGKDLIDAGIPEGPEVGEILGELLEAVIDGALPNERGPLLAFAAVKAERIVAATEAEPS